MEKLLELLKGKKNWVKILILIATGAIAWAMSSCTVQHRVTQSSYNTTTGDSIVIRYEQWGKAKK